MSIGTFSQICLSNFQQKSDWVFQAFSWAFAALADASAASCRFFFFSFSSWHGDHRNGRGWKAPGKGLHVWPSRTRTSPLCRCLHRSPCQSTAPCLCMDPVLAPNADLKTESFLRSLKSILRLLSPKNAKYLCSLRFLWSHGNASNSLHQTAWHRLSTQTLW